MRTGRTTAWSLHALLPLLCAACPGEGLDLHRPDRSLVVAVPGDEGNPLPTGTVTVRVVLDPDGTAASVEAGPYTVL